MNVDMWISYYERGVYTQREVVGEILEFMRPENYASVLARLPPGILAAFKEAAENYPLDADPKDFVWLTGNVILSDEEKTRIRTRNRLMYPLIREWFASRSRSRENGQ